MLFSHCMHHMIFYVCWEIINSAQILLVIIKTKINNCTFCDSRWPCLRLPHNIKNIMSRAQLHITNSSNKHTINQTIINIIPNNIYCCFCHGDNLGLHTPAQLPMLQHITLKYNICPRQYNIVNFKTLSKKGLLLFCLYYNY